MAGSAIGVVLKTLAALIGYCTGVLAARILGAEEFGLYTLAFTTVTTLSILTSGGIEHTLVKLIPSRRKDDPEAGPRALGLSLQNVIIGGTLVAMICSIFSTEIAALLGQPGAASSLSIMAWALPFIGILAGTRAANRTIYAFYAALTPMFLVRPLLSALPLVAVLVWWPGDIRIVAAVFTAGTAIAAGTGIWLTCRRPEFGTAWLRPRAAVDREAVRLSSTFLAINLITNLKSSGLVFIIGLWLTERDLGLFGAANRTAALTVFILAAVNITFAPVISGLWARKAVDQLVATYRDSTRWTLAVSAPACLLLIVCAQGVLHVFGAEYVEASAALAWLSLGQLVNAGVGSVGMVLMMTGRQRLMLWDTIGMTLVSTAAAIIVAPRFGYVGVAAVGGIANALFNLIMLEQVRRQLGAFPYDRRTLNVAMAIAVAAAAGWLVMRVPFVAGASWTIATPIQAAVMLGTYLVLVATMGLTEKEKQGLLRVYHRRSFR
jgi:O-antigen/teichoic acid export membrane protein